jgi:hypothetical protein
MDEITWDEAKVKCGCSATPDRVSVSIDLISVPAGCYCCYTQRQKELAEELLRRGLIA